MRNYPNAGDGLRKIYLAAIGSIVCSFIMIVPMVEFVGAIGVIVCSVITLIGFYQAGKDIEGCKAAFILQIIALIVNILDTFTSLPAFMSFVSEILPVVAICLMCWSVSNVLKEIGADKIAKQGMVAMITYIGCRVVSIVLQMCILIIIAYDGLGLYLLLTLVIAIVELFFYLRFLKNAAEQFGSY